MSEESPAEPEAGGDDPESISAEGGEAAEAATGGEETPEAEAPVEWVPPIELDLPPEVAEALQTVMNALLEFGRTVTPVLDQSYEQTAEEAAAADPLYLPDGLSRIAGIVGDWSSQLDGMLEPFRTYVTRIERENQPVSDYRVALAAHFDPPPPDEPEDVSEPDADAGAESPAEEPAEA